MIVSIYSQLHDITEYLHILLFFRRNSKPYNEIKFIIGGSLS
nr:MAG TPA: hypothetical protein [Caudoviricetes sp.]